MESVRENLIQMGETNVALLDEALRTLADVEADSTARASELEARTDHQHRLIHDQCLNLITLQAPVARDARLITGVLDAIVDLELIGDYAYEIVILSAGLKRRPPSQVLNQIAQVGARTRDILTMAIDSWRGDDGPRRISVRPQEAAIRAECQMLYEKLSELTSAPGDALLYVNLLQICRHFERILRHAVSVAEQAAGAAPIDHG